MDSSYSLPPFPLSYYAHHRHFDSYYRKEHRFFKQTQNWDLFHAWGQERLLLRKENGESRVESSRLTLSHAAPHFAVPTLTNNILRNEETVDSNPCDQPHKELMKLIKMKESINYRIAMVNNTKKKYGAEVRDAHKAAKRLLRQVRRQLDLNTNLDEENTDESSTESLSSRADSLRSQKKRRKRMSDEDGTETQSNPYTGRSVEGLKQAVVDLTEGNVLVERVLCGMHRDKRLFGDVDIPQIPTDYIGGCLSATRTDSGENYMAYAAGSNQSAVIVSQANQGEHFTELSPVGKTQHGHRIKQVELTSYGDELMAVSRMGKSLCLYKVDADLTLVNKLKKGGIRHACMNPYYPEVVYVRNDSIMKWDTQNKPVCVLNGWQPRFSVESDVRSVHYGCHPQQIVMTDPAVCTLYDTRSQGDGVDLFEVPSNRVLHSNERLITSIQSRDFTHYVLAHHTLLGIDERYPKYPLIYQQLPALAWPMLMNSSALNSNTDLLLTGCPTNQEVFSFLIQDGLKTTPLWKCSQPSDMIYYRETQPYIADRVSVESRLNAGLLGLTVTRESNSEDFTVHMLTGKGDLFQQTYVQTGSESSSNSLKEVTHSAGPRLSNEEIPEHVTQRCLFWYSKIADVEVEDDAGTSEHPPRLHVRNIDVTQSLQQCAVCRGGTGTEDVNSAEDFQCMLCGLSESRTALSGIRSKLHYDMGEEGVEEPSLLSFFDPLEKAGSDANSCLLLQLWKGDDIATSLAERDREWDDRRERLLRRAAGEGSTVGKEFDGLSSISSVSRARSARTSVAKSLVSRSSARKRTEAHSVISRVSRRSAGNSSVTFKPNVDFFSSTLPSKMLDTPNTSLKPASQSQSLKRSKTKSRGRKGF